MEFMELTRFNFFINIGVFNLFKIPLTIFRCDPVAMNILFSLTRQPACGGFQMRVVRFFFVTFIRILPQIISIQQCKYHRTVRIHKAAVIITCEAAICFRR